jgi:hypothetical protein
MAIATKIAADRCLIDRLMIARRMRSRSPGGSGQGVSNGIVKINKDGYDDLKKHRITVRLGESKLR